MSIVFLSRLFAMLLQEDLLGQRLKDLLGQRFTGSYSFCFYYQIIAECQIGLSDYHSLTHYFSGRLRHFIVISATLQFFKKKKLLILF